MPTTAAELIAGFAALDETERAAALTLLQNDAADVLKSFRAKLIAAGKAEGAKGGKAAGEELGAAKTRIEELEAELADVKAKAPDAQKIEAGLKEKHAKDLAKKEAELAAERQKLAARSRQTIASQVTAALVGVRLRPAIAKLLAPTLVGRVRETDDGRYELLGEGDVPVELPKGKTAFDVLADEARAGADPVDVLGGGEGGGGVSGGGGGGSGGGGGDVYAKIRADEKARADERAKRMEEASKRGAPAHAGR